MAVIDLDFDVVKEIGCDFADQFNQRRSLVIDLDFYSVSSSRLASVCECGFDFVSIIRCIRYWCFVHECLIIVIQKLSFLYVLPLKFNEF